MGTAGAWETSDSDEERAPAGTLCDAPPPEPAPEEETCAKPCRKFGSAKRSSARRDESSVDGRNRFSMSRNERSDAFELAALAFPVPWTLAPLELRVSADMNSPIDASAVAGDCTDHTSVVERRRPRTFAAAALSTGATSWLLTKRSRGTFCTSAASCRRRRRRVGVRCTSTMQ